MKPPFHGVARTLTIHILAIDQEKFNSVFSRLEIASKQMAFLTMPSYPEKMGAESYDSRVSLWALKRVRWWLGDSVLSPLCGRTWRQGWMSFPVKCEKTATLLDLVTIS